MDNRQSEYCRSMDALRFTEEQKAQLARQVAAGAETSPRPRRRYPLRRTVVLAAALVLILAMGAGATGILKTAAESFSGIFGGDVAQTEIMDKIGRPIGASDTDNGVTITADAIIGDQYNAAIVFTISRDDGTPFDFAANEYGWLPLLFEDGGLDMRGNGGCHGTSGFLDQTPGDNTIQFVRQISSDQPLNHGTATATFKNLCVWDEAAENYVPLIQGSWKFRFNVDYEDSAATLGDGETFAQDGITFTIDEIQISPVAIRVAYTTNSEVRWSDAPSGRISDEDRLQQQRYFENVEILLTKTDGTVVDLSNSGGQISPKSGKTVCVKGQIFDQILPMEELSSISVGGVVYDIPAA